MKRAWTRGEKMLWAAPILFGVVALAAKFGPDAARRAMGWPQVLSTSPTNHLRNIALSADGTLLAASGETDPIDSTSGTIYLWNAQTLQSLKPIRTNPTGKRGTLADFVTSGLAFSPDGKFLGAQRHSLGYSLYQMPSARLVWRKAYAEYAKFSPDGKRIAIGLSGAVTILNVVDGALIRTWKTSNGSNAPYWDTL